MHGRANAAVVLLTSLIDCQTVIVCQASFSIYYVTVHALSDSSKKRLLTNIISCRYFSIHANMHTVARSLQLPLLTDTEYKLKADSDVEHTASLLNH